MLARGSGEILAAPSKSLRDTRAPQIPEQDLPACPKKTLRHKKRLLATQIVFYFGLMEKLE